jgi:hypothetical protein
VFRTTFLPSFTDFLPSFLHEPFVALFLDARRWEGTATTAAVEQQAAAAAAADRRSGAGGIIGIFNPTSLQRFAAAAGA